MARFQLLRGKHTEAHPTTPVDEQGRKQSVTYKQGAVFDSVHPNLDKLLNSGRSIKVQRVPDDTPLSSGGPSTPTSKPADSMETEPKDIRSQLESQTIAQLKELAAGNDIDVSGCKTKDEYVETMYNALDPNA